MTAQIKPPFRADHVGSFLRTEPLKEARARHDERPNHRRAAQGGRGSRDRKPDQKQEEVGLKLATDGEFRRAFWHFDFWGMLDGVTIEQAQQGDPVQGRRSRSPRSMRVNGKIGFPADHPMLEHFKFLKAKTRARAEDDHSGADRLSFPA